MTAGRARLGAIREEPVCRLGSTDAETGDSATFDSCSHERCGTTAPRSSPPDSARATVPKVLTKCDMTSATHLVVAGADVCTDVRIDRRSAGATMRHQPAAETACPASPASAPRQPACTTATQGPGRHEHDRHAVCEEEHQGNAGLAGDQRVGRRHRRPPRPGEGATTGVRSPDAIRRLIPCTCSAHTSWSPEALDSERLEQKLPVLVDG